MKVVSYMFTIVLQSLALAYLRLLDNFPLILWIFIICLFAGVFIRFIARGISYIAKDLGWGLFWGSATSLSIIIGFMVYLTYNFPK